MLQTLFTPDPSAGLADIGLALVSSYDLYRFASMKLPETLDHVRRQAAVLELFIRQDAPDDIHYQQLYMQQANELELFDNEKFVGFFKKNLYNAMLSKDSTASHKSDGIKFFLKIQEPKSPLLLHDLSSLTASFNRATSFVRNKKKREELVEQLNIDTRKLSTRTNEEPINFDEIEKNLDMLGRLTDELDEAQIQKMVPIIQSILSNEYVHEQGEVSTLLYSLEFLLKCHSKMHHESIKEIMPTITNLLDYITHEVSDEAYHFIAKVCIPILDDVEFETYWSDATIQANCSDGEIPWDLHQTKGLRLLTALFSKAKPELISDVLPLIRSKLTSTDEDVNIAAYHALISCISVCDSDEIEQIVSQAMSREPTICDWESTFSRIYEQFRTVIPTLSSEQVIKIVPYFMINYDEDEWPKNLGALIPLSACLERIEPQHHEYIRSILSYLIKIRKEAKEAEEVQEIIDPVTKDIFVCYLKLKENNLIKQYIPKIGLEITLGFFEKFDEDLVEFSIEYIADQLGSQRISDKTLTKFIDTITNSMSSINPTDINKIIPAIIKKFDSNDGIFSDNVNSAALNLILKYILQTTDYSLLKETLTTLKNQDSVRYINTMMESVIALDLNHQPEIIQPPLIDVQPGLS